MTVDLNSLEIRPVTADELDSAIDLATRSIAEIPLYQWLLGPHRDDVEVCHWMAGFFISPHAPLGRVEGAVTLEGEVLGLVVWTAPDNPSPPLTPAVATETADVLPSRPDITARLQELSATIQQHDGFDDCVDLPLVVVHPSIRGSGVPGLLALRAQQAAVDGGHGIALTTSDLALGNAHERTYGAVLEQTYSVGSATIYRYRISPEQARSWRPPRSRG